MALKTAKTLHSLLFSCAFLLFLHAGVQGNLVVNGSFETGDFTGWNTQHQTESGGWVVFSGTTLPVSGKTFNPPPDGTYAAAADVTQASSMILYQDVTLPSGSWILQFTYYYKNYNNEFITPSPNTLDVVSMGAPSNQQFRFDIMDPTTPDPYSVNAPLVLQNLFQTQNTLPLSQNPITVSYDISAFAGQTIRIRFAVAATEDYINLGIDNVAIIPNLPTSTHLKAKKINNRFLVQSNTVVQLSWQASPSDQVVGYNIYDNGNLIGTVTASGPFVFNAPFHKYKTTIYGVTSFNSSGAESEEATVVFEG